MLPRAQALMETPPRILPRRCGWPSSTLKPFVICSSYRVRAGGPTLPATPMVARPAPVRRQLVRSGSLVWRARSRWRRRAKCRRRHSRMCRHMREVNGHDLAGRLASYFYSSTDCSPWRNFSPADGRRTRATRRLLRTAHRPSSRLRRPSCSWRPRRVARYDEPQRPRVHHQRRRARSHHPLMPRAR